MLVALFENDDFVQMYINRYADLASTVFTCENMLGYLDEMIAELEPEMPQQIDRWGGSMDEWEDNLQFLRSEIENKCVVITTQIVDCYEDEGITGPYNLQVNIEPNNGGQVQVNTAIGESYPWNATYFGGVEINLNALPANGFVFEHWEVDNNTFVPDQFAQAINMSLITGDTITAFFNTDCSAVAEITGPTSICIGSEATITATPGFTNYLWSNNSTGSDLLITVGGIYSLTVTDDLGCESFTSIIIEENLLPLVEISGNATICGNEIFPIDAGAGYDTYLWSNNETTQAIDVNAPGNYSVTVTDENGCQNEALFSIEESANLTPGIIGATSICAGASALLEVDNSYAQYIWSNGSSNATLEVTQPGIYALTVTNGSGCSGSTSVEVEAYEFISPTLIGDTQFCAGNVTVLQTTESYFQYQWSTGGSEPSITINSSGTYSVTVTDADGCTGIVSTDVEVFSITPPSISGAPSICPGGSTELSTNGGYTNYLWSNNSSGQSIVVTAPGTYGVSVTDANGCESSGFFIVEESELLSVEIIGTTDICPGETTVLSLPIEYATYAWSNNANTATTTINQSGVYEVTVSDQSGCTGIDMVSVTANPVPEPIIEGAAFVCENNPILISVNVFFPSYLWSNGFASPSTPIGQAGTYTVTVTNEFGCEGSSEITIQAGQTVNTQVAFDLCYGGFYNGIAYFSSTEIVDEYTSYQGCDSLHTTTLNVASELIVTLEGGGGCGFFGMVNSTISGGNGINTYQWSNGATTQNLENLLTAGLYTVTVTDQLGCSAIASENLVLAAPVSVSTSSNSLNCYDDTNGIIDLEINSGTPPFDINWSNGMTGTHLENLSGGTYTVIVTDANNCNLFSSVTIPSPPQLNVSFIGTPASSGSNGAATANVSGGAPPYDYEWSNGAMSNAISGLSNGEYTLTVTDGNSCTGIFTGDLLTTTGVNDIQHLRSANIFPNPSDGRFVLDISLTRPDHVWVEIFDITGKSVKVVEQIGQQLHFPFALSDIPRGSYLVMVRLSGGTFTKKIIVNQ